MPAVDEHKEYTRAHVCSTRMTQRRRQQRHDVYACMYNYPLEYARRARTLSTPLDM